MTQNFKHVSHIKSSLPREVVEGEFYGLTPTADESSPVKINIAKRPTADKLVEGEIAVNYLKGHETLMIKNTKNEIVGFVNENELYETQEIIAGAIAQEKEERLSSISSLEEQIKDNELVVSAALNDLETRKANKDEVTTAKLNNYAKGTDGSAVAASDTINEAISKLENQVDTLKTNVTDTFEDMELVVSSSLNDLNQRLIEKEDIIKLLQTQITKLEARVAALDKN